MGTASNVRDQIGNKWWSRLRVTAAASSDLKVVPPASAVGLTHRLVVEWLRVSGKNTNAVATTIEIRGKTGAAPVVFYGEMIAVTGSIEAAQSGRWQPIDADDTLELTIGGAITGHVAVEIGGTLLPASAVVGDKVTGAP